MTITNVTKTSAMTLTNVQKSTVTWNPVKKAGAGWNYDQVGITYDGPTDVITGLPILYDSEGVATTWANTQKHNL